jgi:hypothetical protein
VRATKEGRVLVVEEGKDVMTRAIGVQSPCQIDRMISADFVQSPCQIDQDI